MVPMTEVCSCPLPSRRARSNALLALIRTALIVPFCLAAIWGFLLLKETRRWLRLGKPDAARWVSRCCKALCFLMGIKVEVRGALPPAGSLIVPNHVSYLDICALASVAPCLFVPKHEVASWPLVGRMVRSAEFPVVSRARAHDLSISTQQLRERLVAGQSVCVFLEGTTTGGDRVRPFFAPMLQPAIESAAPVVPVGLRYSASHSAICIAEDVAYWKDHSLVPHALRLFGLHGVKVEIVFGDACQSEGQERKAFATTLHHAVETLCFCR